jgi:DNA gyrase inhibitor GyrI
MRVAAARAVGAAPEIDAWRRLRAWAEPNGFLHDTDEHPVFGFNNPAPSPTPGQYGYEFWIRVEDGANPSRDIEIKDFDGGLYAVVSTRLTEMTNTWRDLWDWVKDSRYRWRRSHELERVQNPQTTEDELVVDLYLPIQH